MNRAVLLLMSLILAAAVAVGCADKTKTPGDAGSVSDTGAETTSQIYNILVSSLSDYAVVRAEDADNDEIEAAKLIFYAIKEKLGADITLKSDFIKAGDAKFSAGEYEILIGDTNREETAEFRKNMRADDYGYGMVGKKLIITGTVGGNTYLAAEKFADDVIDARAEDGDVFYSSENDYMFAGDYGVNSLTLNGACINEYAIVYKSQGKAGEIALAGMLQSAIAKASGYLLDLYSDASKTTKSREILIGVTARETGGAYSAALEDSEYYIGTYGGHILLWAGGLEGNMAAVRDFAERISLRCLAGGNAALTVGEAEILRAEADMTVSAMSFNVLVSNITSARAARVTAMVQNYLPDTVGFQEVSDTWLAKLDASFSKYYSYVGEGRNGDASGEYNPIFYLKDKFTLIESGTKWLSDTPERPSKYGESSLNRILTYAVLKRNSDGKIFVHINTHLEHTSGAARVKQAAVLVGFIEKYADYPVILTGDFNCASGTEEYKAIDATNLVSSADAALKKENDGATFHSYGSANKIIDFIFVSDKKVIVDLYKVANEKIDGDYASDHHPVYIEYSIIG